MAGFLLYMRVTRQPLNMEEAKILQLKLKHEKPPMIIYRELDKQLLNSEKLHKGNPKSFDD